MSDDDERPLRLRRGQEIKLMGNASKNHKGYTKAWLDTDKTQTEKTYWVILQKKVEGGRAGTERVRLVSCKVSKRNCVYPPSPPTNMTEIAFQEIPQLMQRLEDFARIVAECRLEKNEALFTFIESAIDRATMIQMEAGSSARYRYVDPTKIRRRKREEPQSHSYASQDID